MRQKDIVWGFPETRTSTPAPRNREPSLTNTCTSIGTLNGCHHYPDTYPSTPAEDRTCLRTLGRSRPTPRT